MANPRGSRPIIKLVFWTLATAAIFAFAIQAYVNGDMARLYFHKAKADGYAINDKLIAHGTVEKPVILKVEQSDSITGLQAIPVKKGDLLPENATGVIDSKVVAEGRRVALEGDTLKVMIPWELTSSKGFTTKETFRHKNVETNPMGGVWNLTVVLTMGLCLGLLAESITDVLGIKVSKSAHAH